MFLCGVLHFVIAVLWIVSEALKKKRYGFDNLL